ncbi:hypothetical protein AAVH_31541, partial [Aphelenchoides avenae]
MSASGESGHPSESRGSPLTDDSEDVIVERIARAESKRRNDPQRAHSTSTFDAALGRPVAQTILFVRHATMGVTRLCAATPAALALPVTWTRTSAAASVQPAELQQSFAAIH